MAEIVNLNRFRKAKTRADEKRQAAENRVAFGRTKAEKAADKAGRERAARTLDGVKRDETGNDGAV
jgi:hypothetical protein